MSVSVIIPSRGQARYLPDAISSVRMQNVADIEVVVAAGSEAEAGLARALGATVVDGCDRGPGDARNRAIEVAKGPYILPLDADDMLVPLCVSRMRPAAGENTIVSSPTWAFGDRSNVWMLPAFDTVLERNPLSTSSMFPKAMWRAVGGFDHLLGYEDWDYWIRCSKLKPKVVVIREPLLRYRVHAESAMARIEAEHLDDLYKAMLRLRHPDCYPSTLVRDRQIVGTMPAQVVKRLDERLRAFPKNPALLAFRAMVRTR